MSQNLSVQLPFYSSHYWKYDISKTSAKYHKISMSRFWEIVFCVPLLFHRHVSLSNLKHELSRELPLTTAKTVFSHLECPLKLQCQHPFSQSKISLSLNVAIQVLLVMHLGPLSQLCFGSMSPVVSAQTAVYWSLPRLTEVKLENTDVKLAMIVGV